MPYPTERAGQGRWCIVQKPAPGTLWTDDVDAVGFEAVPNADPAPVHALLDTASDAGRTPTQAFDELAALIGSRVIDGDLGHWKPNRNRSAARR